MSAVDRVTVSLPAELREAAQRAAVAADLPFSTVVSEALTAWLRNQLVDAWLVEHQDQHGSFDEDELQRLAVETGIPYLPPRSGRSAA